MEYKIIRPYGPTIYHGRLTEDEITYLQGVAKDTQTARNNVGYDLAGNIKDQLGIVVKDLDRFNYIITPLIKNYVKYEDERVRIDIGVAYGSDIDKVRDILLDIANKNDNISKKNTPRVRFRTFGESSINFQLLFWIRSHQFFFLVCFSFQQDQKQAY